MFLYKDDLTADAASRVMD